MKYSLRSLMLLADADMSGILVEFALIIVGGPLILLGIILGVRWLLTHHASVVAGLVSLKFTIREILMITAMVAIFLGWLVDHSRQAIEFRQLLNWKNELYLERNRLAEELTNLRAPDPNPPKK
jgi:hypothetical protein